MQERITSTRKGSITSVQAVYVPADDLTDPAPATTFSHWTLLRYCPVRFPVRVFIRRCNPLESSSRILSRKWREASIMKLPEKYKECFSVIRNCRILLQLWVWMNLQSEEDKLTVNRARKVQRFLSQSFSVAEQFTGMPGQYVPLKETLRGFKMILDGECDELPESCFPSSGTIDEVFEKAKKL